MPVAVHVLISEAGNRLLPAIYTRVGEMARIEINRGATIAVRDQTYWQVRAPIFDEICDEFGRDF